MKNTIVMKKGKTNRKFNRASLFKKVPFGEGVLMPVFIQNNEEVGVVIAKHKNKYPLGEIVPAAVAEKNANQAKPLTYLSFPNNVDGRNALNSFREWLDIVEESFKEREAE